MTRYLLDTGIAGYFISRRRGVRERAAQETARGHRIGICMPVLAELWYGVEKSATRERNLDRLQRSLADLKLWPFDERAAEHYGRLMAELVRAGRPMGELDVMVAAVAFALGNTVVVSADSDLSAVPGLTVENWAAPGP